MFDEITSKGLVYGYPYSLSYVFLKGIKNGKYAISIKIVFKTQLFTLHLFNYYDEKLKTTRILLFH